MKFRDITGNRFGKLVVIRQDGFAVQKDGRKFSTWLCRCDCGNEKILVGNDLTNSTHSTKSCGCLVKIEKGQAAFNRLYHRFQKQAKERNYVWNLTKDQVREITSKPCHYCGISPSQVSGEYTSNFNGVYIYNGIDRVDNGIGYTLDNVVPCCSNCNHAKSNRNVDEFREWAISMFNHWASLS